MCVPLLPLNLPVFIALLLCLLCWPARAINTQQTYYEKSHRAINTQQTYYEKSQQIPTIISTQE
jgi:hypothetical protein